MEIIAKKDNIIEESISKEYATYSKEEKKRTSQKVSRNICTKSSEI